MTVLLTGIVNSMSYGLVGIVLMLIGYFAFDFVTSKIDVQEQLNKGNTAVAIVVAALLLGIAYVAGLVVHG